jgi:beta-aspartyl-peptidase (threonine type)
MKIDSKPIVKFFNGYVLLLSCMMFFLFSTDVLFAQTDAAAAISLSATQGPWSLVIHGGAGGPGRGTMAPEKEKAYLDKLNEALQLGSGILSAGGSSLDAVEAVVRFMEDCPLFNAGKGAVLNENGKAELDASIMDGMTGMAGAVAGVTTIKNPVTAARRVMEKTSHVMLIGAGAEKFARAQKLEIVDPSYFITPERLEAWKKNKAAQLLKPAQPGKPSGAQPAKDKPGTVGAVALDSRGSLAAATSTGGMMGKMTGRVGDSPIIGAGTYANNNTCAVSATGHGEYFIRNVVAYDVSALMEYRGMSLDEAGNLVIMEKLKNQKASGGLIAIDKEGNVAMPFNTNAMFRGFVKSSGEKMVAIY